MAATEVSVYRYRGIDADSNATIQPRPDAEGQQRYATMAWINANRNVRVEPGTERRVSALLLDMNGMCFLPDSDEPAEAAAREDERAVAGPVPM